MKTAEKLAAGWLITLGFMMTTLSAHAMINKHLMYKDLIGEHDYINDYAVAQLDTTAVNGIIFGLPSLALGGWLALGMRRQGKQEKNAIAQQMNLHLQSMFYRMIAENEGRITVLGFAMQSQLPPATAREFLDDQAKQFNANFKVSEDGAVSYHFDI
ncbi:hypothetical protein [Rivularia sp. UHCC 0363]|uniref:hypothetical protein n=1 Tax=Rivularia sp. UHCC 0363 TaxID=3110244 RepID=UPI002B1EAAA8|nr:hypothetical protein [Rivularia sp. UHCC 0363]MEA5596614.1 hypothetical protein [Rivularia sp. UHCC 0363]